MKQLDLNLIRVFLVLLEKKNTRIAAESLAMSQPAVSKALARLRSYFDDQLFTRVHSGLMPTPRAVQLGEELPALMERLDHIIIGEPSFDASQYKGELTIAMNGFISNWLGSSLIQTLSDQAPNAQINIVNWDSVTLQKVLDGEILAAINYSPLATGKKFTHKVICKDDFIGLVKKGHPKANQKLTIKEVESAKFASLVVPGWNDKKAFIDEYLSEHPLHIQVRSSYLQMLLDLLKQSELILPCSSKLANHLGSDFECVYFMMSTPEALKDIIMVESHNKRMHPMNAWLRGNIIKVAKQFS